jgi:hypothetical protein
MAKIKTKEKKSPLKLTLTSTEIEKLYKISSQHKDVNVFTLSQDRSSGIGPTTKVSFDLFSKSDTWVDITDVSCW